MKAKYIYGVIKTEKPSASWRIGRIGIGSPPSKVVTVVRNNLAAVVSDGPWKTYETLAKEETIKDLVTHQFVIEKVMVDFDILPVKFGTMVETEEEVIKFLDKGCFLLQNQLRRMEGKIELDLVAAWKLPEALTSLYSQSRWIKRKQREITLFGNKATLEDKVALGKLVEKALNKRRPKLSKLILQALKKEAVDVCFHDLPDENMIFNAAFLVEKDKEEFFNKALNFWDQKLKDTLLFRLVGPLPPYSFSTILFERINPAEVKEAKKTLGLNGKITDKEVSAAYRQLAKEFHPDKNPGANPLQFHLIDSAYRILINFVEKGYFHIDIYRFEKGP